MNRFLLFTMVLIAQNALAMVQASNVVHIDLINLSDKACLEQKQRIGYTSDSAFGVSQTGVTKLRVSVPSSISKENITAIGAKLISPRKEILELSQSGRLIPTKYGLAVLFDIPNSELKLMGRGTVFQFQIMIFTHKQEYVSTASVQTFNSSEQIEAYFGNEQCYFSTSAVIASDLYFNKDNKRHLDIEYSPKEVAENDKFKQKTVGILDISFNRNPGECVHDYTASSGISASLFSMKDWRSYSEKYVELSQKFTLSPLSYGYIVRQDIVTVTRVQKLKFDTCGMLTGNKNDVYYHQSVLPAFTLMGLNSSNFSNQKEINEKLLTYTQVNTCPRGK